MYKDIYVMIMLYIAGNYAITQTENPLNPSRIYRRKNPVRREHTNHKKKEKKAFCSN